MQGKVVVISGGTNGLGKAGAEKLAGMGARIVLIARDKTRAEVTLENLRQRNPHCAHTAYYADLSNIGAMKKVVAEIIAAESRIDVLINNAGAVFRQRLLTEDGLEKTFTTNHLSYFVLTLGLLPLLKKADTARIVLTASDAHKSGKLDFDDLQCEKNYRFFRVYGTSKLCNILFTRELARRLQESGITANCFHPGFVASNIGASEVNGLMKPVLRIIKSVAISPEKGARTLIYLASSPEGANVTGGYFDRCRKILPSQAAQDYEAARRLWEVSARLTGIDPSLV